MIDLPPPSDLLITMTIAIDRDGNVYQDTQTHGNTWAEVYRGTKAIEKEIHRLIDEQSACPFSPKIKRPKPAFAQEARGSESSDG